MNKIVAFIYLDETSIISVPVAAEGPGHKPNSWVYVSDQDVGIFPETSSKARELAAAFTKLADNLEGLGR